MDSIHRSMNYLADQITQLEAQMSDQIDPREFGRLEGRVERIDSKVGELHDELASLNTKFDKLAETLTEAKGGWRALMWVAGASATLGGVVVTIVKSMLQAGPR